MKYAVISADSHIVEPRDLWTAYMERAYKDDAPHIESISGA
ncbi:MAG: amidohydrolase, partial [Chloroflexi bacterium]|nr:amidohydrolase [Chloroflexota bacterium]